MFVVDSKGAEWRIDEGLRDRADQLIQNFYDQVGHVETDKVIFLRLTGAGKQKWLGKCYYIGRCPQTIIPKFVFHKLNAMGLLNLENTSMMDVDDIDLFDLRYIIALNDDLIQQSSGDIQRVEDGVLLHELMHIHPDQDKLVKHDVEDFAELLDKFGVYWTSGIFKDEQEEEIVIPKVPISGSLEDWTPPESS